MLDCPVTPGNDSGRPSYGNVLTSGNAALEQIPVRFEIGRLSSRVVAGLVPATSIAVALCVKSRGRRHKPGDAAVT